MGITRTEFFLRYGFGGHLERAAAK